MEFAIIWQISEELHLNASHLGKEVLQCRYSGYYGWVCFLYKERIVLWLSL